MSNNWFNISQSVGTGNATITVNIQSNPGFELRTGRIIVSNGNISKTVSVVQNPKTPSLSAITVTANGYLYAPYSGGTITSADSKSHLVVTAIYDNGDEVDVTSAATYASDSDEFTIPVSTSTAATFTQHWFYWRVEYQNKVGEYFDYLYQEGVPETRRITYSGTTKVGMKNPTYWHNNDGTMTVLASVFDSNTGAGIFVFDKDVTFIPYQTFDSQSGLTAINIPSSVTGWSEACFIRCRNLTTVNGLEDLAQLSFMTAGNVNGYQLYECNNLTHIGLPASLPCASGGYSLPYKIFGNCSSLTTLIYAGTKAQFNALRKQSDWRSGSALRYVECSNGIIDLDNPSINDTITYYAPEQLTIADSATTPSFTSHTFSNGVGTIKASGYITEINRSGFTNCSGMTSIELPDSLETIHSYAFTSAMSLTNIVIPDSLTAMGDSVFWRCTGLTSVNIPTGITTINESTFSTCSSLTGITIPDNITTIANYAFYRCSSLPEITIPSSVTKIGTSAFGNCSDLITINYNGTMAQWSNVSKGVYWNRYAPATVVHCTDGDVTL